MISFVENLVDYLKTGQTTEELDKLESCIGRRMLRLICLNIIEWLKIDGNPENKKPLKLNSNYPWCMHLHEMINSDSTFSEVFTIKNHEMNFNRNISSADIENACQYAAMNHNPPRMR